MFFISKRKVEEDLEKIRKANLPIESYENSDAKFGYYSINQNGTASSKNKREKFKLELEKNDILAMIIAVFSIVLPYVLCFILILSSFVLLLKLIF